MKVRRQLTINVPFINKTYQRGLADYKTNIYVALQCAINHILNVCMVVIMLNSGG